MSRKILFVAMLAVFSVSGLAQTTTQTSTTPANGQPFGGPIINTPNTTFATPAPEAGISDAGRAGISVGSTTETAPAAVVPAASAPDMSSTGAVAIAPTGMAAPAEAPTNDMGVSVTVNDASAAAAPISVADAASHYKTEKTAVNARTLNNEDVQQIIRNKGGVTIAGNTTPAGIPEQNAQPLTAQTQGSQTVTPQPSQSATQPQAAPETTADNATTPQINENQQANDAQGSTRLPATATFLPLLGLMGLASGGFGLWVRKFRK